MATRATSVPATDHRRKLLAALPVTERRLELGGITTAVLEGGDGPPIILLHGPAGYAAHWLRVIPDLVPTHRVIAPDLPGHGATDPIDGPVTLKRVLDWLDQLIERTCASPPVLVGHTLGGAIGARFAAERGGRIRHLVLEGSLGLAPFQPAPAFGQALGRFVADPTPETHDGLWEQCAMDLGRLRSALGEPWETIKAYNLEGARTAEVQTTRQGLMEQFAFPPIPPEELARITVPTTLIWGRQDRATPLSVAERASERYGWPLHDIENAAVDPSIEQPEAFVARLNAILDPR